jgi:hypothetical protein
MQYQVLSNGGNLMRTSLATFIAGAALAALAGLLTSVAAAHHSFAAYDSMHPLEAVGTVREFIYTNPHSIIVLDITDRDGNVDTWILEGSGPGMLVRSGWNATSLKPGDVVRMTIEPLRSGAHGGAWDTDKIRFIDGTPIVPTTESHLHR